MRTINWIAAILVIVGGINWGLVGVFKFNLVDYLFARIYIDRIIYVAVGVAAVYMLFAWPLLMKPKAR